jgi:hypothetical protein
MAQALAVSTGIVMKATRGLTHRPDAYLLRPNVLPVGEQLLDPTSGKETEVVVSLPGIPANADVQAIEAILKITEPKVQDPAGTAKIEQTAEVGDGKATTTYHVSIGLPSLPRNLSLRLDGGEVFWTHSGSPTPATYKIPNFAEHVNAYLDKLPSGCEQVQLRFWLSSDGFCCANPLINVVNPIPYSLLQTEAWPNPLDGTIRLDRNLRLGYGQIEELPLTPVCDSGVLSQIRMDLTGEFGRERLLGDVDARPLRQFATISSDYSLAQAFVLPTPITCVGMAGCFQVDADAGVYVEIQQDANGFPATASPLAYASLSLTPDAAGAWGPALFGSPIQLEAAVRYWLVVKGVQGKTHLGLRDRRDEHLFDANLQGPPALKAGAPAEDLLRQFAAHGITLSQSISGLICETDAESLMVDEGNQTLYSIENRGNMFRVCRGQYLRRLRVNRGGQIWRDIGPVIGDPPVALLRLIYVPEPDNQTAAIEVGLKQTQGSQRHDPRPEARTISIPAKGLRQATLVIKSYAQGQLNVANVIQEYSNK